MDEHCSSASCSEVEEQEDEEESEEEDNEEENGDNNNEDENVDGEYESEDQDESEKSNNETAEDKSESKQKKQKRKKKRNRKARGHRRNIVSKYDNLEDLNPEALSAQNEEVERIRRLELQQSLLTSASRKTDESVVVPEKGPSVMMVDLTADDDDDDDDNEAGNDLVGRAVDTSPVEEEEEDSDGEPPPKKKIRRMESKQAAPSESLASMYECVYDREDKRVLVNVNHPADEEDIFLGPQIARAIKPHQIGGVRFMFDNVIESVNRYESSQGFGCILADAMGLGKTLQVISFIDIFMRHTVSKRVLCVVPVNTLQNWLAEFNHWLPPSGVGEGENEVRPRNFTLFMLSETVKSMEGRREVIFQWFKMGGVLIMGYEMYRLLALSVPSIGGNKMAVKKRKSKKDAAQSGPTVIDLDETEREMDNLIEIQSALCDPGPELIICDEGHRIKNDTTNLSHALKKIRTRRRIVLTGYPLQNNLLEYWCMVDFIRPKYLGTKQEFLDLFERPMTNGQCIDSTTADVRLMKYRSHVLHRLLRGFILRRGHEILRSVLPPKFEHVILVRTSHIQRVLYDLNMLQTQEQQNSGVVASIGPLKAFAVCSKIWNHPDIYYDQAMQQEYQSALSLLCDEGFLNSSSLPESSTCKLEWPSSLHGYETGVLENSPKMMVMMAILELSVAYGDRILIFSQSLSTLTFIEKILASRSMPVPYSADIEGSYQMSDNKWQKGKNYYRLDGSTGSVERDRLVCQFNSPSNYSCWVFLLSTKAGCLGINLTGANRVIVVDVSWNPCYDSQAVCRVYRYGQTKPSYIYRLVSDGSMEKRMYDRQISKQGMANRVVDELNPERHFTNSDILSLLSPLGSLPPPCDMSQFSKEYLFDSVLMQILKKFGPWLTKLPFKHESLLIDSQEEKLSEVEKYVAMKGFHQQLTVMRKGQRTYQPHPQQQMTHTQPLPQQVYSQQVQPHLQQANQVQPHLQQLTQAQPYLQQVTQAQPHLQQFTQPHPQALIQHQNQSQAGLLPFPHPANTPVQSGQQAYLLGEGGSLVPIQPGSIGHLTRMMMTQGNVQETPRGQKDTEVICIDSDSDSEESGVTHSLVPGSGVLLPGHTSSSFDDPLRSNVMPTSLSAPGFSTPLAAHPSHVSFVSSSSLPVAAVPPSIPGSSFHDNKPLQQQNDQLKSHTPSEAAVANALAGFVQFQKNMCKDLGQHTEVGPAKLALNTLANTLQVFNQNDPSIPNPVDPVPDSEVPVCITSPTSMTESPSCLSPLSVLMSSLQDGSRKAAIVTPISHRPPSTSS